MRNFFLIATIFVATLFITGCGSEYDDSALTGRIDSLEARVAKLEQLCNQMNTNISSLQTIVNALQQQDYITNVSPITEGGKTIGYTITFAKGKSITIYHGEKGDKGDDGANGENGANGKDGTTPIVNIKKDTDGNYYWTINGEWLLDESGKKIIAQDTNGEDGKNGSDGKDGKNGITPQLKIEDGYWHISYDNGTSWQQIGSADGQDGVVLPEVTPDEPDMFKDVTQDDDYVYFTLADDTIITLPKEKTVSIVEKIEAITYIPEASDGKATMIHIIGETERKAELNFAISPKGVISEIENNWQEILSAKAVNVVTRAVDYIDIPILEFASDVENGTITLTVSGKNIENRVFTGEESVSLAITFADAKSDLTSDFVPLLCKIESIPVTEIWYASTTNDVVTPNTVDFGANIVSNKYKDNKGLIKFDGIVTHVGSSSSDNPTTRAITRSGTEDGVFSNNHELSEIYTSDKITAIGDYAFYNCQNLRLAEIGGSVETIGTSAFQDCNNLETVTFSDGLKKIGTAAFYNANNLKSISLPSTLEIIDDSVFYGCASIDGKITVPSGVKRIGKSAFYGCETVKEIELEEGVLSIDEQVFNNCSSLEKVVLPSSLAFIKMAEFPWDAKGLFEGCWNLHIADVPFLTKHMFRGSGIQEVNIGNYDQMTEIPEYCFYACGIQRFVVPENVTEIGVNAFGSSALQEIDFSNSRIEVIGGFSLSTSLTTVKLPKTATRIADNAFSRCPSLTYINFENVTTIGSSAFYRSGIEQIDMTNWTNIKEIGMSAFEDCEKLTSVIWSKHLNEIPDNIFGECENLTSVEIPSNVTKIGRGAFQNSGLESLTLPNGIDTIALHAFRGCRKLKSVTLPESISVLEDDCFSVCTDLTSINLPDNLKKIGACFSVCKSLTTITIPKLIDAIDFDTFYECNALESIYFTNKEPAQVASYDFFGNLMTFIDDIPSTTKLYVPADALEKYKSAEGWKKYADRLIGY